MSGKMQIKLKVNGEDHEFLAEPRELLVHALRERLNLTGSHVGCETGHCGGVILTIRAGLASCQHRGRGHLLTFAPRPHLPSLLSPQ